jgi:hypothetical protein
MQKFKSYAKFGKITPARRHRPKEPIPRSISANQLWSAIIILLTNQERGVREMSQSTKISSQILIPGGGAIEYISVEQNCCSSRLDRPLYTPATQFLTTNQIIYKNNR